MTKEFLYKSKIDGVKVEVWADYEKSQAGLTHGWPVNYISGARATIEYTKLSRGKYEVFEKDRGIFELEYEEIKKSVDNMINYVEAELKVLPDTLTDSAKSYYDCLVKLRECLEKIEKS